MFSAILNIFRFISLIIVQFKVKYLGHEPYYIDHNHFWTDFETVIEENTPPKDFAVEMSDLLPRWAHKDIETAPRERPFVFDICMRGYDVVNETHQRFIKRASQMGTKLPFNRNTSGIVMTTFKKDIEMLVVGLKMVRRSQTTVPIEVFLDRPEDNQNDFCHKILTELNAECKFFSDFFNDGSIHKFGIREFTYKPLSMLFSSFENVLFLDTDNIVVSNLDDLFTSEPFTKYGMVVWPDSWTETVSHIYYHLIGVEAPPNLTNASIESGQFMISKTLHGDSLLLSLYYNIFGRGQYYKILNQNSHGEGDKDTYHAAAEALGKPFYRMHTLLEQMNDFKKEIREEFLAMHQFNPIDDYKKYELGDSSVEVRRLFIHSNFCKFRVEKLMERGSNAIKYDGTPVRVWLDLDTSIKLFGFDIERIAWESAIETAEIFHPDLVPKLERYYRIIFLSSGERLESMTLLEIIQRIGIIICGLLFFALIIFLRKKFLNPKKEA